MTVLNQLFIVVPESVGLLIFGLGLIVLTSGLRWFLKPDKEKKADD